MASQSAALLHSMIAAAMMFERTARGLGEAGPREVEVNAIAIRLLSQQMARSETAILEHNIWAVLALGYSGAVDRVRVGKLPQQSFLKELQSLHIYGRLIINKAHLAGLIKLVSMIGGPQNLVTPGMAAVMSL
jgi:hypothetical protein